MLRANGRASLAVRDFRGRNGERKVRIYFFYSLNLHLKSRTVPLCRPTPFFLSCLPPPNVSRSLCPASWVNDGENPCGPGCWGTPGYPWPPGLPASRRCPSPSSLLPPISFYKHPAEVSRPILGAYYGITLNSTDSCYSCRSLSRAPESISASLLC